MAPKFEGWIEKLYVNTTGQPIARGQPLAEVYSPELVSAQREYLVALQCVEGDGRLRTAEAQVGVGHLASAAWSDCATGISASSSSGGCREGGEPRRTMTMVSPVSGVVVKEPPVAGMRFMPGEALFQIADLSRVWLIGDVFEQEFRS